MIHFIRQILRTGLKLKGATLVLAYLTLLIVSSLLIMIVEPPDSALTRFDQALWWSVVTSTTVGYGDLFPVSNPGKIVAEKDRHPFPETENVFFVKGRPDAEQVVSGGDGIWMMAQKRPLQIDWP